MTSSPECRLHYITRREKRHQVLHSGYKGRTLGRPDLPGRSFAFAPVFYSAACALQAAAGVAVLQPEVRCALRPQQKARPGRT
jgi:hypothetical protein